MRFNPDIHRRRSIRLRDYDYSRAGAFFVTICAFQRKDLFGDVMDGALQLNEMGKAAQECWNDIPGHFPDIELDEFVVMPNHLHGIVVTNRRCTACRARVDESFGQPVAGSLATIIRSFKSAATKRINTLRDIPGAPVWQRNYYERIIRDDRELDGIRQYIIDNPSRWEEDENHPSRQSPEL